MMAVIAAVYALLCLGAVTMIYPFGMMLTGSVSSRYDYEKYNFLPRFVGNEKKQFAKFLFEKYGEDHFSIFASTYRLDAAHASWRIIAFDEGFVDNEPAEAFDGYDARPEIYKKIADDFDEFKATVDPREVVLYDPVEVNNRYWRHLEKLYLQWADGDRKRALVELRRQAGLTVSEFRMIIAPGENQWMLARWFPSFNRQFQDWIAFKEQQPKDMWCVIPTDVFWQRYLSERYGRIDKLNKQWGLEGDAAFDSFWQVPFLGHKANVSDNEECRNALDRFLGYKFPLRYISLRPGVQEKYRDKWISSVQDREKDVATLLANTGIDAKGFDELTLAATWPKDDYLRSLWVDFLTIKVAPADYTLFTTEGAYRAFLLKKYGSLDNINTQYATALRDASAIPLPSQIADVYEFKTNRRRLFWHYMARNYTRVFEFLVFKGRALVNTLVLVSLAVAATLTVNPMAAYALSRYSMRSSHKILIFFLATMAFPPGVTMIPNFLLMRSFPLWQIIAAGIAVAAVIFGRAILATKPSGIVTAVAAAVAAGAAWMVADKLVVPFIGGQFQVDLSHVSLLNTYAALIVPGLANGFAIFLLKGFFDSLPRELYEAGMIDGASEFKMFRMITIPLCKPILAVIALGAFTAAYSGFMWAFIVCQKQSMWTMMVWLYQFQMRYTPTEPWLVMASLVVVSVPTLVMFLFCQRIILRGIIIPTMK
ncbi:MAG: carbohydrate ABC transporter permease [Planctomycetes bacterium]|nr:carbohydrate ABC transporter permease [Planctomycetota bacterium]